jgi:hypothetical protein
MKSCNHTHWLSLCTKGGETGLLQAERPQALIRQLPSPHVQQPSLLVLIGNAEKANALRTIFSLRRSGRLALKRNRGEIHLHLEPSSAFGDAPVLIAEGDITVGHTDLKPTQSDRCHKTIFHPFRRQFDVEKGAIEIYRHLLSPFTDVFCFFSVDLGGYSKLSCLLARWLEADRTPGHAKSILPSVIIVDETDSPYPQHERDARDNLLRLLQKETEKDPFELISRIDVVAVLPRGKISNAARYRRLKERLMEDMRSTDTCLCCLRRRPQYCLPCGHSLCENCIIVFGMSCADDACVFTIQHCFLCDQEMEDKIIVRTRPPTAGAGILCIDGGGTRGIIPLTIMKLIQDRLGSIPLQRCIPLSFGVSIGIFARFHPLSTEPALIERLNAKGAVIVIEHFILGRPLDESIKTFSDMVAHIFQPRASIPIVSPVF